MNINELEQLGLSHKEAVLYLASLELGRAKASDLADYTGINRGTVYDIAKTLFKHGLMSAVLQGKITYFIASPPERFISQMNERLEKAEKLAPEIEALMRNKYHRPKLRFYEGEDGLKAIYHETLKCQGKQMLQFVSVKDMIETVSKEFMLEYIAKRARKHITLRNINAVEGEIDDRIVGYSSHTDSKYLRQSRIAPKGIDFPSMMMVYDDFVTLMSTKEENFGFIIESREFAAMMRSLFEVLWNISKPA